ncbi:MAG TPA: ACP phosphodiesterase [Chitinophagaceae bacterium]|nr:ACP phosphodiesterase [Chitinophagaceae bacterium]MCC6634599.1 DUF479 domain-containing protein [Chitinophagaceae bacterium]HMZ46178.1 ACP phosphodiesterase [Chitinophagaceae bacterium]HNE92600.1 ACP phosphodiesterase [Chitinophagaceae bacterium]HNF30244.1 ACP phosphodiesterase [Chitinophagaceae bacterium]
MNYLAHAYLSFNKEDILIGNMISDFIKGKRKFDYPLQIQKGIQLHRNIDSFTDNHFATKEAKQIFKPVVGLYAGAFIDVVYDHFLAIDKTEFETESHLNNFTQTTYKSLMHNYSLMPPIFQQMLLKMKAQNWLFNYQFLWGIEKSFEGVVHRAKYLQSSTLVYNLFIQNYSSLQNYYSLFFKDVKAFSFNEFSSLISK